ncbi:MAG: DUF881 domain-containing protein [Bifidobacteriaceae bacterium]|jgi:uncharacterized protein YlxW (UPF0749 family)|nr:DUF881 domain-containing protein [Bifidobacteriaceae bacterium]MCI1979029.1 DUF881 domain-containing protein [Bifidobacteriaceae bacterium]
MSRHGKRRSAQQKLTTSLIVLLICAVAGYLFEVNVRTNGSSVTSSDTGDLLEERTKQVNQLQKDITDLSSQIDTLKKTLGDDATTGSGSSESDAGSSSDATTGSGDSGSDSTSSTNSSDSATVLPAYSGQGMTVTLSDSPLWQDAETSGNLADSNVNDYVVHQQDLEAVINAFWAGGAEAMMIQDQRVLPTTAVRCVGNVLLLQGKQYAPPYTVSAIGPVEKMQKALDTSTAVIIYKQYVESDGLGWEQKVLKNLKFPESTAVLQTLKYASEAD